MRRRAAGGGHRGQHRFWDRSQFKYLESEIWVKVFELDSQLTVKDRKSKPRLTSVFYQQADRTTVHRRRGFNSAAMWRLSFMCPSGAAGRNSVWCWSQQWGSDESSRLQSPRRSAFICPTQTLSVLQLKTVNVKQLTDSVWAPLTATHQLMTKFHFSLCSCRTFRNSSVVQLCNFISWPASADDSQHVQTASWTDHTGVHIV